MINIGHHHLKIIKSTNFKEEIFKIVKLNQLENRLQKNSKIFKIQNSKMQFYKPIKVNRIFNKCKINKNLLKR